MPGCSRSHCRYGRIHVGYRGKCGSAGIVWALGGWAEVNITSMPHVSFAPLPQEGHVLPPPDHGDGDRWAACQLSQGVNHAMET